MSYGGFLSSSVGWVELDCSVDVMQEMIESVSLYQRVVLHYGKLSSSGGHHGIQILNSEHIKTLNDRLFFKLSK